MSATLGGLIKDYRLQKNIAQLEVAFALGWKEPSRLSRIEQGKVGKPKRDLLERIMDALRLEEDERNQLLLSGSYLPTNVEIEKIRKEAREILDEWEYPAMMLDFSWRSIDENNKTRQLYDVDPKAAKWLAKHMPRVPEILFREGFVSRSGDKALEKAQDEARIHMLAHFKFSQRNRTKEKWYTDMISKLMKNPEFRDAWLEVQKRGFADEKLTNCGKKIRVNPNNPKKLLIFDFFIVPFLKDPRFMIEFYTPSDKETLEYFRM